MHISFAVIQFIFSTVSRLHLQHQLIAAIMAGKLRHLQKYPERIYENVIIIEPEGNNITIDRVIQLQRFMSVSALFAGL